MTRLREALERARARGEAEDSGLFTPEKDQDRSAAPDLLDSWTSERESRDSIGHDQFQGGNGASQPADRQQDPTSSRPPSPRAEDGQRISFDPPRADKLVVSPTADPMLVEEFRRLAAALHHAQLQGGVHTVMVASAVEAEGKTLTAANLALTLSHSYQRRVLLIDADLRRPSVHELFGLKNHLGLGGILKYGPIDGSLPVQQILPQMWVMTAGLPDPDPIGGLVSETMKQVIGQAAEHFDWVVIDTPPVATLSDANLVSQMIDTAVLVVGANTTPYAMVARAIEAIGASRILGVVLNRVDPRDTTGRLGYYGHYGYARKVPSTTSKRWGWSPFRST